MPDHERQGAVQAEVVLDTPALECPFVHDSQIVEVLIDEAENLIARRRAEELEAVLEPGEVVLEVGVANSRPVGRQLLVGVLADGLEESVPQS